MVGPVRATAAYGIGMMMQADRAKQTIASAAGTMGRIRMLSSFWAGGAQFTVSDTMTNHGVQLRTGLATICVLLGFIIPN